MKPEQLAKKLSGATDKTLEILKELGIKVVQLDGNEDTPKQKQCKAEHAGECGVCTTDGDFIPCA